MMMRPLRLIPTFKMLHIPNFAVITIFMIFSLVASSDVPTEQRGLTVPLIPPTSPRSPFYSDILKANNISLTANNITLDRGHYLRWLMTKMAVHSNDYGEVHGLKGQSYHVMDMYLGDPEQFLYGIFDTGSDLVWFQCEERAGKGKFPYYNQTKSSTYKPVNCGDKFRCNTKCSSMKKCQGKKTPCEFSIDYMDETHTNGVMGSDIASFKPYWEILHDFVFGCSTNNSDKMMGVIGASNSDYSLPAQLYPQNPKFSYCISDDFTKTSLVKFGAEASLTGEILDMMTNPNYNFYYIDVVAIQVNGEYIDVKPFVFEMSEDGKKGFIIDSGTSMTILTSFAFSALKDKIEHFLGPATPYFFPICYPPNTFSSWWTKKKRPVIGIEFGDFVFSVPENRAWVKVPDKDLECLQILRTYSQISILGSDLLLNVNVGHDPVNDQLFLDQTSCPTAS